MRNIALILKYEGSAYHGFQTQKTEVTVQATLERAISMLTGEPCKLTGCGRTDAGVHARCYLANFRTESRIPTDRIPYAMNTHLPNDIAVVRAFEVSENFNAIGSCVRKEYSYLIHNSRVRDPFYINRAWQVPAPLDEKRMAEAAAQFLGTHDFAAMRSVGTDVKSTVRRVFSCEVERSGELLVLRVSANGFLYNMARAMVGTLVYVSEGKILPSEIAAILEKGNRTAAGPTVPPGGLYMTGLWYEDGERSFSVRSRLEPSDLSSRIEFLEESIMQ